jgi:hypothetical protein
MTKKPDAEPKAGIKPPYEVAKEDILFASGLMSEICGLVIECHQDLQRDIWKRAACIAELLRQMRKNAEWAERQEGDASK